MKPTPRIALALLTDVGPLAATDDDPGDVDIDPGVHCSRCSAICCRLTVVLGPLDDAVPRTLTTRTDAGLTVMTHRPDGYCVALGADGRTCSIYEQRPQDCRSFTMGGPYCRSVRAKVDAAS